jgi:hypothetical protein
MFINEIKASLTKEQQAIINAVWEHRIKQESWHEWISQEALYRKFAKASESRRYGKDVVLKALRSLSGSILYQHNERGYGLTFLGMLLTDECQDGIDLLERYVKLVQAKYDSGLDLKEIKLTKQELGDALKLSEGQLRPLRELIDYGRLGSVSGSNNQWEVSMSSYKQELLEEDDLKAYIEREALKDYDPSLPASYDERSRYLNEKRSTGILSEFSFIRNDELRELLEADWKEVQAVNVVRAWKSCVILCGSILEGMLFDILSRDEPKALTAYRSLPVTRSASSISDLNLASLVDVASALKILPPGTFHLSHALRHSRNLVHPEKLLREKVEVLEEDANIALSSVRKLLRIAATI